MSTTLCGLCCQQPSRYKCPTCQVPYCSLGCYKPHKLLHVSENSELSASSAPAPPTTVPPSSTTSITTTEPLVATPAPAAYPPRPAAAPSFGTLLSSPAFSALLSADPNLKRKLHQIYKSTQPSSSLNMDDGQEHEPRRHFSNTRGSRGRYRGGTRYGGQARPRPWTQEHADESAVRWIRKERGMDGGDNGMEEFVRVLGKLYADNGAA